MSGALEELRGTIILHLTPTLSDMTRYLFPAGEPGYYQTPAQISEHQQELATILPIVLGCQGIRFIRSQTCL